MMADFNRSKYFYNELSANQRVAVETFRKICMWRTMPKDDTAGHRREAWDVAEATLKHFKVPGTRPEIYRVAARKMGNELSFMGIVCQVGGKAAENYFRIERGGITNYLGCVLHETITIALNKVDGKDGPDDGNKKS